MFYYIYVIIYVLCTSKLTNIFQLKFSITNFIESKQLSINIQNKFNLIANNMDKALFIINYQ